MRIKPSYKPLEITLIKRDKLRKHLREEAGISGTTLAKMSNGGFVSLEVIARICDYLDCRIEDVVEFVEVSDTYLDIMPYLLREREREQK